MSCIWAPLLHQSFSSCQRPTPTQYQKPPHHIRVSSFISESLLHIRSLPITFPPLYHGAPLLNQSHPFPSEFPFSGQSPPPHIRSRPLAHHIRVHISHHKPPPLHQKPSFTSESFSSHQKFPVKSEPPLTLASVSL